MSRKAMILLLVAILAVHVVLLCLFPAPEYTPTVEDMPV